MAAVKTDHIAVDLDASTSSAANSNIDDSQCFGLSDTFNFGCYSSANSSHGLIDKGTGDQTEDQRLQKHKSLSLMDRLLPLWIISACILGLLLGQLEFITKLISATTTSGGTNLLVGAGLMLMMYPALGTYL